MTNCNANPVITRPIPMVFSLGYFVAISFFISYSHRDRDLAEHARDCLRDDFDVFLDDSIRHGQKWTKRIEESIARCNFFVIVITYNSLRSQEVKKEISKAIQQNKTIIPCKWHSIKWDDVKWKDEVTGEELNLGEVQGLVFKNEFHMGRELYDRISNESRQQLEEPTF